LAIPIKRLEEAYREYQDYHKKMERIDSAITLTLGKKYFYHDNETPLYSKSLQDGGTDDFATDLVYVTMDRRAIIFVEETSDPTKKQNQLKKYANITPQSLLMISRGDSTPFYDVFLFFPDEQKYRTAVLDLYKKIAADFNISGFKVGISLWQYSEKKKCFKCIGGSFSEHIKKTGFNITELPIRRYGSFPILKKADTVSLLQYIILKAVEREYGKTEGFIEFDKTKLTLWMKETGIKEERWKTALEIGVEAGIIRDFSPEQLTGTIAYTKPSSKSISILKRLTSNFFETLREIEDLSQKSLEDFDSPDKIEEAEKRDEEEEQENEDILDG